MSQHSTPIVGTILFVADQRHPWKLAQIDRFAVAYHTPTTVRVGTKGGTTRPQTHVYCIADDAAWGRVQYTWSALQTDLNALADGLRTLGSYASRLAAAGGIKTAPNPLCATVISAPDPDTADEGYWFTGRLIPRIERDLEITSHTPKMLHVARDGKPWSTTHQRDHFVCPDDAAWQRIEALIAAAQAQAQAWEQLLRELGTYQAALADGRYAQKEEPMPAGALAVTSDVRVGIAMMDQAEAREVVEQIKTQLDSARRQLLDLYEREGWKALGYTSWRACAVAEFGQSSAQIYRLLSAAQIEQAIDSPIGEIPEAHLREVGKLDTPALQRQALDRADQLAGDKPRTAKHVEQAAAEIKPKPATCIRCGAERSETRSLTSYQAGLIDAYPGRAVTLCSRCIPELLRAQRAAQRESEVAAPAQPTAAPFWQSMSERHPTAHLWTRRGMNEHHAACGMVTQRAPSGSTEAGHCSSCVRATWPQNQTAQQPTRSELAPITVQTSQGPREVVPLLSNGVIALHISVAPGGTSTISHVATGRAVAQWMRPASAEAAYQQLIALDWQLTPEGGTGPVLGLAISRIVTQYDDVDHYELRLAKLRELEAAARPVVSPIDDLTQRMARDLEAEYGIPVEVEEWTPAAPAQPTDPDPRTQIAALLTQIAPLLKDLKTEDQLGLSQAIADLNECQEDTEPEHWLNVGWALLDLVPESAVAP
jgi:hypothetical protein